VIKVVRSFDKCIWWFLPCRRWKDLRRCFSWRPRDATPSRHSCRHPRFRLPASTDTWNKTMANLLMKRLLRFAYFPMFVSETVSDSDTWQSLLYLPWPPWAAWQKIKKYPICAVPPKVTKASTVLTVTCIDVYGRVSLSLSLALSCQNFVNVNTALSSLTNIELGWIDKLTM
jgi:hypothetical protein